MKIMLVVPPEEHYMAASAHKALDHKREARPHLGILSVATYLKNRRPEIVLRFIDGKAEGMAIEDVIRKVREFQPDMVGLTCLTFNYYDALRTAKRIKETFPASKICMGGWHATLYPRETLAQEAIDYVVFGEGERTFLELVDAVIRGCEPYGVPGLGFKTKGKAVLPQRMDIVINEERPVHKLLDEIDFPDFRLVDIGRYSHILNRVFDVTLPLESSRGCPFACTFCDIRRTQVRYRTAGHIADEMERWVQQGVRSFFFVDDNITVNKPRSLALFQEIVKRQMNVDFKVSSRVDRLDDEIMHWMKRAGVSRVSVGIETTKQKYLDFLQKDITVKQIEDCLARAHNMKLPLFAYMILGLPGQTRQEMLEEADFLKKHKVEYASFSLMTVYPKTELHHISLASGQIKKDPWQAFAENPVPEMQVPYVNGLYSVEELKRIQLEVTRSFYFSPRVLYRRIREINSFKALSMRSRLALRFLGFD